MKTSPRILLAAMAITVMGGAASVNAQTLETVRVRLPNGQTLSLDSNNWQRDRRVVEYQRYYFEPRQRVYVVYNDNHKPHHHGKKHGHKKHEHKSKHHGHHRG